MRTVERYVSASQLRTKRTWVGPVTVCLALTMAATVVGQEPAPKQGYLQPFEQASYYDPGAVPISSNSSLAEILARLEALEQKEKAAEKAPAKSADKGAEKKEVWTDVSTEKWTVRLGGHVQLDYVLWADHSPNIVEIPPSTNPAAPNAGSPGAQNYFEFRRLRLVADGTGYGVYDFRLQMTLEPETVGETPVSGFVAPVTSPDVKDAYFSCNEIPYLGRFRIGNFFVPFGLEQVTNDTNNVFLERSIPTQGIFTADRELGMALYNCTDSQRLSWASGIFFDNITDSVKERINDNQGYRVSQRISFLPYYDELNNGRYLVYTGAGVLYTKDQDNLVRFRARPQVHEGPRVIDSLAIPADSYTTGNLEFAIVNGPLCVQSEAYLSQVNRNVGGAINVNGAYVHASYFVTGENRIFEKFGQHGAQFGRNQPFSNVYAVPGATSLGALELKARWSHLDLSETFRGQYNDFTFGFNWYWSDRTRVMVDWIHPITSQQALPYGPVTADLIGMRFDFNW